MTGQPAVSIVVPVLDEGATIAELVRRVDAAFTGRTGGHELVIVDDGSSPAERRLLRDLALRTPTVRLVELERNAGQASALVEGLRRSLGAVVVTMDGDLQDPPEELPALLDALGSGAAVATARRDSLHGAWWRRAGSRVMTRFTGLVVGVRLNDYGGQFNAYRREVVDALVEVWEPRAPLLPSVCRMGFDVVEVPLRCEPRESGRSRYGVPMRLGIVCDLIVHVAPVPWRAAVDATATGALLGGVALAVRGGRTGRGTRLGASAVAGAAAAVEVGLWRSRRARGRRSVPAVEWGADGGSPRTGGTLDERGTAAVPRPHQRRGDQPVQPGVQAVPS